MGQAAEAQASVFCLSWSVETHPILSLLLGVI